MYVAVKGGERAIDNAHAWLAEERRGDTAVAELSVAQIRQQLALAVNRVMAEGSLYDPDLAALAIKQGQNINKSLLALCTVIRKLASGDSKHIPFRDSKLTRLLSTSLGGNTRTTVLCCTSPSADNNE